jgi:hypothetical protein
MTPSPTQEQLRSTCAPVLPTLWIGGDLAPVPADVTTVVTLEASAPPLELAGVTEFRFPFRDSRWEPAPREPLDGAVAAVVQARGSVLVRCRDAINRSALVLCLALLSMDTIATGRDVVGLIRSARPDALINPYFVNLIRSYPQRRSREEWDARGGRSTPWRPPELASRRAASNGGLAIGGCRPPLTLQ